MAGYTCPHCGRVMAVEDNTYRERLTSFANASGRYVNNTNSYQYYEESIMIGFYRCPACEKPTIYIKGMGSKVSEIDTILYPSSLAKQYPEYVPSQIRNDYEEACAILYHSPKASATLARRCLQGMIRDYWGISRATLNQEITALKDDIPADLWNAIDNLRKMGNIGAHMEKDTSIIVEIDPDEATRLIKLIELLIKEWYIAREERKRLFEEIDQMNTEKQRQRQQ